MDESFGVVGLSPKSHPCTLVKDHNPEVGRTSGHHVLPRSWQVELWGEVRFGLRVALCDTHHTNTHLRIDAWKANRRADVPDVSSYALSIYTWDLWLLASSGRWDGHGEPPIRRPERPVYL